MFRALLLVALAFAAVSAQRWPMITVNAAGDIVLQSLTRAQSFVFTPATVNTGPTTGTTSATTATRLTAGINVVRVLVPSGVVANHGVTLPTPVQGQSITLLQSDTTFAAYTIWTDSNVFINAEASTTSIPVNVRRVTCTAVTNTRWDCDVTGSFSAPTVAITATTGAASVTAAANSNAALVTSGTGAVQLTNTGSGGIALAAGTGGVTVSGAGGIAVPTSTTIVAGPTALTGVPATINIVCVVVASGKLGFCSGANCAACTPFA